MTLIQYPDLPIVAEKDNIIAALQQHPVIVVAGETGSGKTTQLPKIALEAGCGQIRKIGHTQPRRLAARNVAFRIASELHVKVGSLVGYKVRFSDQTTEQTRIQLMTDGILLSETQHDKYLSQYDCLIIDEAHERSINIDFLLGYIKNLLKKRRDLKVIITSATIDVEKFSLFFDKAPLIHVPGRSYPIEVNYLDALSFDSDDPAARIAKTVEIACQRGPGDILIFQSGEKEIRELAEVLAALPLPRLHILPLYARQSTRDQQKIFDHYSGRKIIIATNVAETSVTVPNIRFVIDPGLARINRYSYRNKLQRLPIEPISQASAEQRKGRCGRVGPGICYRLYEEADLQQRPLFTEPEILRVNLAGVILRMLDGGFRPIETFPLIEPLDPRYVKDGLGLLYRLGAIDEYKKMTPVGRQIARIPLEPRFSRMLMGAVHYGCLKELLVIVSALSIVDPREWPEKDREKAETVYAPFKHEQSDFLFYLALWDFLFEHKRRLSHQKFRLLCRQQYLSYLRVCEWWDVHEQLTILMKELGFHLNDMPADYSLIHRALLTGLLESIGIKEDNKMYKGVRQLAFYLHPSSALFKRSPLWVMACDIVHTTKTFARMNAMIEPEWVEEVGQSLLKRDQYHPHFDPKRGEVMAFERVNLMGLIIAERRKIRYETVDFSAAREIFIRQALCEEMMLASLDFYEKNKACKQSVLALEDRVRKHGTLLNEEAIFDFYQRVLPAEVASVRSLKRWLENRTEKSLIFPQDTIVDKYDLSKIEHDFPSTIVIQGAPYAIEYVLDFRSEWDGATLVVPIEALKNLKEEDFTWPVPGLLAEKLEEAIRSLPKKWRLAIGKIPLTIPSRGSFGLSLSEYLKEHYQIVIEKGYFDNLTLPAHLSMHFCIIDPHEKEIARGHSLVALYHDLKKQYADLLLTEQALEKKNITAWQEGDLPLSMPVKKGKFVFTYFPAWVDQQNSVSIQLFESKERAHYYHIEGLTRLFLLHLAESVKSFKKEMKKQKKIKEEYYDDIVRLAAWEVMVKDNKHCYSQAMFHSTLAKASPLFLKTSMSIAQEVVIILQSLAALQQKMQRLEKNALYSSLIQHLKQSLHVLCPPHFIATTPLGWLYRYRVYLEAMAWRLDKFPSRVQRDQQCQKEIDAIESAYKSKLASLSLENRLKDDPVLTFRYLIEELRVSFFAESLKTVETVSRVRLLKLLENLS